MAQVRGFATLYDALGAADTTNGTITVQAISNAALLSLSSSLTIIHADTTGQLIDPVDALPGVNMAASTTYRIHRGNGPSSVATPWALITTPSSGTFTLTPPNGVDPYQ